MWGGKRKASEGRVRSRGGHCHRRPRRRNRYHQGSILQHPLLISPAWWNHRQYPVSRNKAKETEETTWHPVHADALTRQLPSWLWLCVAHLHRALVAHTQNHVCLARLLLSPRKGIRHAQRRIRREHLVGLLLLGDLLQSLLSLHTPRRLTTGMSAQPWTTAEDTYWNL